MAGGINGVGNPIGTAELYNPATGKWTATGKMITARDEHPAILLSTGNVLLGGGEDASSVTTSKTELYNPSPGKWTAAGNLNTSRLDHTMTMLMNGNVMITGGNNVTANTITVLSTCELCSSTIREVDHDRQHEHAARGTHDTLLASGKVLAASGSDANNDLTSAELYAQ